MTMHERPVSNRIMFANQLRGLAALSVLIHHYFLIFFKSRGIAANLSNAPLLPNTQIATPYFVNAMDFYPFFDWGAFGVSLFFLISGFVIPFSLQKLTWREFLLNRILRILPVYMIGFSITVFAIFICGTYFHRAFPYHFKTVLIHYFPGIRDLLRSTNIDGIVWTLEIEIKFYLLCALMSAFFKKNDLKALFVPIIIGLCACASNQVIHLFAENHTFPAFLIFHVLSVFTFVAQYLVFIFMGAVFNYYHRHLISYQKAIGLLVTYFILFCLINLTGIYRATFPLTFSYVFALGLFSMAFIYRKKFKGAGALNFFADISYPLYVVHGALGMVLLRILLEKHFSIVLSLGTTMMTAISFATVLHYSIERPIRRLVKQLEGPQVANSSSAISCATA